jgi:hypothetical protein
MYLLLLAHMPHSLSADSDSDGCSSCARGEGGGGGGGGGGSGVCDGVCTLQEEGICPIPGAGGPFGPKALDARDPLPHTHPNVLGAVPCPLVDRKAASEPRNAMARLHSIVGLHARRTSRLHREAARCIARLHPRRWQGCIPTRGTAISHALTPEPQS